MVHLLLYSLLVKLKLNISCFKKLTSSVIVLTMTTYVLGKTILIVGYILHTSYTSYRVIQLQGVPKHGGSMFEGVYEAV